MLSQIDLIVAQVNDLSGVVEDLNSKFVETDRMDETDTVSDVQYGQYRFFHYNIVFAHQKFQFL